MNRGRAHRWRILAIALTGCCLASNATCLSRKFADDIATDIASDVAGILVEALFINPLENALADPPESN